MFEDTKGVIRSRINQGRTENAMAKWKRTNEQTMIYNILHRQLQIE
jgi:hypothetical protein